MKWHQTLAFALSAVLLISSLSALAFWASRQVGGSPDNTRLDALGLPSQGGPTYADAPTAGVKTGRARVGVPALDPAWLATTSRATGIPAAALRAYATTEVRMSASTPGCHIGWPTLAGIGWIESRHGTIDGRRLLDDGHPDPAVVGPALDGSHGYAAIRSTSESVKWHGDATWEHAFGPMQFIASTWERWQSDGDGDGLADPNDIDDAAYAAARYLCFDGYDLATGAGWSAAIFAYNHDPSYVQHVHDAAVTYVSRTP